MRIGQNPAKDRVLSSDCYHRIVIPVYVPDLKGYFEHGLEVTKLCIESVIKTRHNKSFLTIVNNGSCKEVSFFLQELYKKGKIDQLVHYRKNIGKIDAVIPIAKACQETLVTISDGDVLFKNGWIQAVEEVFHHFPEAGMVAPVPHGTVYATHTCNTLFDATLKGRLKFQSLCDPKEMLRFAKSIGRETTMYKKSSRLKYQLTVKRGNYSAVVGCGHFVATIRNEVFKKSPQSPSKTAYSPKADMDYIDLPNEKAGFWRLATSKNYAYHIGNQSEAWMYAIEPSIEGKFTATIPKFKRNPIPLFFKKFVVKRILLNRIIRPYYFKSLGLKEGIHEY